MNFYHAADPQQHCCEVQLVVASLLTLRDGESGLGGHHDFNKFRSSFEVRVLPPLLLLLPCRTSTTLVPVRDAAAVPYYGGAGA